MPEAAGAAGAKDDREPVIKTAVSISIAYPDKTKLELSFLLPASHLLLLLLLCAYPGGEGA